MTASAAKIQVIWFNDPARRRFCREDLDLVVKISSCWSLCDEDFNLIVELPRRGANFGIFIPTTFC
jgi:hypothetical protein